MNRPAGLLLATCLAIAASGAFAAGKAGETPVLAQDLMGVRGSNGVLAALWTRRADSYTLQLVFGRGLLPRDSATRERVGQRIVSLSARPSVLAPLQPPETSAWLLRADGSVIRPHSSVAYPSPGRCTLRCNAVEVLYRFATAEAEQAIAAAVKIGEEIHTEKLQPLVQVAD